MTKNKPVTLSMDEAKKRAAECEIDLVEATYLHRGAVWPYSYRITVGAVGKATQAANPKIEKDGTVSRDNFVFMVELVYRILIDAPFEISRSYIEDKLDPEIFDQICEEVMQRVNLTGAEKKS